MDTESISSSICHMDICLPIPLTCQRFGVYLPAPISSPDLTPLTSPLTNDSTNPDNNSKYTNNPCILQNGRETPEGFTLPYNNLENLSTSESETSFLSPTPIKFMHSTIVGDCIRRSESCITNAKSSIDLSTDVNRGKCFTSNMNSLPATPTPTVSKQGFPLHVSEIEENISSNQTLGYTTESNVQFDTIPGNLDVLKWDYAGDLASNHLNVSRIHSRSSHSCRHLNYNDYGDSDISVALTWPSCGTAYLSSTSKYSYSHCRKRNFTTRINHDDLWYDVSRKNKPDVRTTLSAAAAASVTAAASTSVIHHSSFISSPDPEDDLVTNSILQPLENSDTEFNPILHNQSLITFSDNIHLFEELENDQEVKRKFSQSSLNEQMTTYHHNNIEVMQRSDLYQICLNTSQYVLELKNHADRVLKATLAAEKCLQQRLNHLSIIIDKNVDNTNVVEHSKEKYLQNEPLEPCSRTTITSQSVEIDAQVISSNDLRLQEDNRTDNNEKQKTLRDCSIQIDYTIADGVHVDDNDEHTEKKLLTHQQPRQDQRNDSSSLWTTSVSDRTESDSFYQRKHHNKTVIKQQLSTRSTSLPQLPIDNISEMGTFSCLTPENTSSVDGVIHTPRQDPTNYSAITTITPMNADLQYEISCDIEMKSCQSSTIEDGNFDREMFTCRSSDAYDHLVMLNNAELLTNETSMPILQLAQEIGNRQTSFLCEEEIKEGAYKTVNNPTGHNVQLANTSVSSYTSGSQIITSCDMQPMEALASSSSAFPTMDLCEYIPSRYTSSSLTACQLFTSHQICPTSVSQWNNTPVNYTDMISIKQNVQKSSINSVEQNSVKEEDLLEQTEFNGILNSTAQNVLHTTTTNNSCRETVVPICCNRKESSQPSSVAHCHHIQPIFTPHSKQTVEYCTVSLQTMKSQNNDNQSERKQQQANRELCPTRDNFLSTSSVLTNSIPIRKLPLALHSEIESDVDICKAQCYPICSYVQCVNTMEKSSTRAGQTEGLSVESIGSSDATYRIQPDGRSYLKPTREISPSNVFCQLNGCELKPSTVTPTDKTKVITDCPTYGIQQPANTATRSTLVTQLRYTLLKQKLKLLRAQDAYHLRRRIVNHLEEFLHQAASSETLTLPDSMPDDWDTDTPSILTDVFEEDVDLSEQCDNQSVGNKSNTKQSAPPQKQNWPRTKPSIDKCGTFTDKHLENEAQVSKKRLMKTAVTTHHDGHCSNGCLEMSEIITQIPDHSGTTQMQVNCSSGHEVNYDIDNRRFTELRRRAEHQLLEMLMMNTLNMKPTVSNSHRSTGSLKAVKFGNNFFLRQNDIHDVNCHRHSSCHCSAENDAKQCCMSKSIVADAYAASGGISWFQPFYGSHCHNVTTQSSSRHNTGRKLNNSNCVIAASSMEHSTTCNCCICMRCKDGENKLRTVNCSACQSSHYLLPSSSSPSSSSSSPSNRVFVNHEEVKNTYNLNEMCNSREQQFHDNQSIDTNWKESVVKEGAVGIEKKEPTSKYAADGMNYQVVNQKNSPSMLAYEIGDNFIAYECTNLQTHFRNRMSPWISRCEARQKRLHLASAKRRHQKAMNMECKDIFHQRLLDQYTKRPIAFHSTKVYVCHACSCEGGSRWRDLSNCCVHCSRRLNNCQPTYTARSNGNNSSKTTNSHRSLLNFPSQGSAVTGQSTGRRQTVKRDRKSKICQNYLQNQQYIEESKLAQLRVNRLRMKIYGEKILRCVLQRRGAWSMTFKEI
ncbi:unnamed protein product [Heterobilharzia americana]|nr:unnamed protein product [Heterobilharzia americana]